MDKFLFFAALLFAVLNVSRAYPHYEREVLKFNKNCTLLKNKPANRRSSVQLKLISDCLYYYFGDRVYNKTGYRDTLSSAPPLGNDLVKIKLISVIFNDLIDRQLTPFKKFIKGVAKVSWKDSRLSWNRYEWNLNVLKFAEAHDIWLPEPEWFNQDGIDSSFSRVSVSYDGIVSAEMTFNLQLKCYEMPGEVMPFEKMGCCGQFGTKHAEDQRQYVVDTAQLSPLRIDERLRSRVQDIEATGGGVGSSISEKWRPVVSSSDKRQLNFCASVKTVSKVERTRYLLPIMGAAILVLAAPLFGAVKLQLGIKLFSFLLQFLCFDNSLGMAVYAEWIQTVPVVYRLHELTFIVTLISIFFTLLSMGLSSINCRLPPPHWCQLLANSGLKFLAFGGKFGTFTVNDQSANSNGVAQTTATNGVLDKTATSASYGEEWNTVVQMVHNFLCLLLSVVYLIVALGLVV